MAAVDVLAFTDSWTRNAHGLPVFQCLSSAPVDRSLHHRLSLIARAWVVHRLHENVCLFHFLLSLRSCNLYIVAFLLDSCFPAKA
jgi:hypothetical protein